MSDVVFEPFNHQVDVLKSKDRKKAVFTGKRGGKTEVGAIQGIVYQEKKLGWKPNGIDPFTGVIIAPTTDMLRRLSMKKFLAYSKPFYKQYNKSTFEMIWRDDSIVYGLSAEKPERIEGIKANWIWIDEAAQIDRQVFLEANARVADSKGHLFMTTSLGVQYINPRTHWLYQDLKDRNTFDFKIFEWATADNPHFPREELDHLRDSLDPRTYRAMFEIDWNIPASNRVYDDFDDLNISSDIYQKELPVWVAADWGWNDPTVFLFIQYDPRKDQIYVIDEIYKTKTDIPKIMELVRQKPYRIAGWFSDAAGLQVNEQTARSNIKICEEQYGIKFRWKRSPIISGITVIRTYVKSQKGERKLIVDKKCRHTIDEFFGYRYKEKNGMVLDEIIDADNHAMDALRYWFVNYMNERKAGDTMLSLDRWQFLQW